MVSHDHADPSIGCVLTSPAGFPGVPNIDFVIFPPRWVPMENTFRVPWFHRNPMSEFMGLIHGSYDAKPDSFKKGACSIHNKFIPHGPDGSSVKKGIEQDTTKPDRYADTMAFMWESQKVWKPTSYALTHLKDQDYMKCWSSVPKLFDPNKKPEPKPGYYPFNPSNKK